MGGKWETLKSIHKPQCQSFQDNCNTRILQIIQNILALLDIHDLFKLILYNYTVKNSFQVPQKKRLHDL
jgi:hypothetical protein